MKNKILTLTLAAALYIGTAGATSLTVNGSPIVSDVAPMITDGRTLVPVRALFESLGATVEWDATTKTVTATKGQTNISIQLDSKTAYVNGYEKTLDVPAQNIENRVMIPARFVAESLGAQVSWDQANDVVKITTDNQSTTGSSQTTNQSQTAQSSETTNSISKTPNPSGQPTINKSTSNVVYITKTGKRYHYDNKCNGGTYYSTTLSEAQSRGLTPCNKCVN